ncbi:MAG: amino acid racemase [Betaproteobacteria bacterium]|nr:amino acid racemase [Betaproteobacteria bacterium]
MDYLVGVLGGMGPAATADFIQKLIELTDAGSDQQHIPLLVSSIPDIPDRGACLLNGGLSPLSALLDRLQMLENAGAACIVIPCNTAHYWFPQLKAATSVEMLNLIDMVAQAVRDAGFSKVGVLATDATLITGLYQTALEQFGVDFVIPEGAAQQAVMDGIFALKAGATESARGHFEAPYQYLQQQKVDAIILGCTEIPIALAEEVRNRPAYFVDSNKILAQAVIRWYERKTGKTLLRPSGKKLS